MNFPTTLFGLKNTFVTVSTQEEFDCVKDAFNEKGFDSKKPLNEVKFTYAKQIADGYKESQTTNSNKPPEPTPTEPVEPVIVTEPTEPVDFMTLGWNELKTFAKEKGLELGVSFITVGSTKEDIQAKLKEALNGNSIGSDN